MESTLIRIRKLAFCKLRPFLQENLFNILGALSGKRCRRIELPAVTEHKFDVFPEIFHCAILAAREFLAYCSKVHRVRDFIEVTERTLESLLRGKI